MNLGLSASPLYCTSSNGFTRSVLRKDHLGQCSYKQVYKWVLQPKISGLLTGIFEDSPGKVNWSEHHQNLKSLTIVEIRIFSTSLFKRSSLQFFHSSTPGIISDLPLLTVMLDVKNNLPGKKSTGGETERCY